MQTKRIAMLTTLPATVWRPLIVSRFVALVSGFCLLATPHLSQADAITSTWQGGADGDWSVAANWSPATAFPNKGNTGDTYTVTISSSTVTLTEDIALDGLTLTDTTLSGAFKLTTAFGGTTLSNANTLSSGLTLQVAGPFAFSAPADSLVNHGTVQFDTSSSFGGYVTSSGTLTNSSTGLIRFNPSDHVSIGDYSASPFVLQNSGTVLADNGYYNALHTPVTQSATGLIRATSGSSLAFQSGGTLSGTIQADASSMVLLSGYEKTYSLDQLTTTGTGTITADITNLTGSLASGTLNVYGTALTGAFTNHSAASLLWKNGTRFSASDDSLTNHGTVQFDTSSSFGGYVASSAILINSATGLIRFNPTDNVAVGEPSASPFVLQNSGTILADNNFSYSLHTPVTNTGFIRVASGSSLSFQNNFTQTAGEVRVENASLSTAPDQTLDFQGGLLRASGSIYANLSLADTALEIGDAQTAGALTLQGNATLLAGTSLAFDLNALTPGTGHDFLAVSGQITLGGNFSIRLSPGLAASLTASDAFTLVSATSLSGTFANIQSGQRLDTADYTGSFLVTLTSTDLILGDYATLSPLEDYLAKAGVHTDQRAATDDPDGDGVPNLLEFALGLEPLMPDSNGLPDAEVIDGKLTLTYVRAQPSAVTYEVRTTIDLDPASWTAAGVTQGTPDINGRTTATIPYTTGPRFLRLHVTLAP